MAAAAPDFRLAEWTIESMHAFLNHHEWLYGEPESKYGGSLQVPNFRYT
jgi:hypothetical protein